MLQKIITTTTLFALFSGAFCHDSGRENNTKVDAQKGQAQIFKTEPEKNLAADEQFSVESNVLETLNKATKDDLSTIFLMSLEGYREGSLSRAAFNVSVLRKMTDIDHKLQQLIDLLSEQK